MGVYLFTLNYGKVFLEKIVRGIEISAETEKPCLDSECDIGIRIYECTRKPAETVLCGQRSDQNRKMLFLLGRACPAQY